MSTPEASFNPSSTELFKAINLIEASAGTGKTYAIAMLVLRFVVEQELDIKQILVVTFTKAATEELKDRIRLRLAETRLAITDDQHEIDVNIRLWLDSLDLAPELIIQRLNNALLDIDQAGIFTIHGFCQRILAEHALESGQLFDSELTGDISAVKQACSDDFWRKQIYPRSVWEASLLTAEYKTPDQLLASVDFIAADLTVYPVYQDLDQKLLDLKQLIEKSKQTILFAFSIIEEQLPEGKFKKTITTVFKHNSQNLIQWLNGESTLSPDFSMLTEKGLLDSLNGVKFKTSKAKPLPSDEQKLNYLNALAIDTALFDRIDDAIKTISLTLRRALLETLTVEVDKRLLQLNVLSFDDLISRFASALKEKKGQLLRQEIQYRYQAALIDEFQDTDQSQWFIFSTLFDSPKHYLYLIGDPKQAIYKFRGADIHSYFAAQQQAQHHFTLGSNWRSHPKLVAGVNGLFARKRPFYTESLKFHNVNPALTAKEGTVTKNGQEIPPLVLWPLNKTDNEHWSAGKAANEIKIATVNEILALLSPAYNIQIASQSTRILPRDIAILVRSNPQAKAFQQALNEAGVAAVINSRESVFSSAEATDLLTLLLAIAQPTNNHLLKQALTLSCFNLNGQQLFKALNDELIMDGWLSRFLDYQQSWHKNGFMVMMRQIMDNEKILPHLSMLALAERRITNLQHCIELIQQAAIDEHLGVNKTLDWLQHNINQAVAGYSSSDEQQLRIESDEDAVKIITMHSAKGLEFPIVFCPFLWQRGVQLKKERHIIKCYENDEMIADLGSALFEQHREMALQEELAEDLRVFYVAVTRAKYRCYLNWADVRSKDKANDSAMAYLLDFYEDNFIQQQEKLKAYGTEQPAVFECQLIEAEQTITASYQLPASKKPTGFKQRHRALYTPWQMSSYTALSSLSIHDAPELPDDKAQEEFAVQAEVNYSELPRGAHTGNVIHDLLENIPFHILAEENDISQQREKSCLRYGLKTAVPEQIDLLLKHAVNTPLSQDHNLFSLNSLKANQCLKEMPFYLSMQTLDAKQINHILKDDPTYQPLSKKTLCGYLTGFIDLICEYDGQYYVIDYKSNSLETYEEHTLVKAMREHNYGLQYWIYSVVLHQYLKNRLPGYSYEEHVGGVKYLFVRGMDESKNSSGVYQIKPEFSKVEQLTELFIS